MDASPKFVDLFAGIGGMRIPLQARGMTCVFTSEIDAAARATYSRNFNVEEHEIFGDITNIDALGVDLVPDHDFLVAGFPCQPFSTAGKRLGFADQTRGTLFFFIAQIVLAKKPKIVLLENVRGLLSNDNGRTFRIINDTLVDAGYFVFAKVLNARDFGLPQNRQRLFIVGLRDDIPDAQNFDFPQPTFDRGSLRLGHVLDVVPDEGLYISDKIWASHQSRKIRNRELGRGFGFQVFHRASEYSATISARYYKDGSEILIDEENGRNPRKLSSREALRLQGFPEWFFPHPSYTQATKQAGNSVPVPVVDALIERLAPFL